MIRADADRAASLEASKASQAQAKRENAGRCQYCDDTGDVHSIDGEWRGVCVCPAGKAIKQGDTHDSRPTLP